MLRWIQVNTQTKVCHLEGSSSSFCSKVITSFSALAMCYVHQLIAIFCSCGTGTLITPIAPHSLSFRPLVVPESSEIVVHLPANGRSHARCADGNSTLC